MNISFWRHYFTLTSAKRRNFWAATKIGVGSFYSGKRTDWLFQTGYKVFVPVYIGMESDRKWVTLPDGSFITQIYRLNLNFLFSPYLSWYNFAQYENQTKTIGWQSRFQWIVKPGKEIFLTFNSPVIDPLERFHTEVYEARVKIKYTIRFRFCIYGPIKNYTEITQRSTETRRRQRLVILLTSSHLINTLHLQICRSKRVHILYRGLYYGSGQDYMPDHLQHLPMPCRNSLQSADHQHL